ncbi:MAG: hypothetical protein ABJK20_18235 [Halieaceae bacterium]
MLKLLTDRHVIIALLVAPALALLAWFAVGNLASEQPQRAQAGKEYPLVEQSNCRYESGVCELRNEDMVLKLSMAEGAETILTGHASHALSRVLLAITSPDLDTAPREMRSHGGGGKDWRIRLDAIPRQGERIRLVATADGVAYYAEASTQFLRAR